MFGLNNNEIYLYAAVKIFPVFHDASGNTVGKNAWGTAFTISSDEDSTGGYWVTNRHVVDARFGPSGRARTSWNLEAIEIEFWRTEIGAPNAKPQRGKCKLSTPRILYSSDISLDLAIIRWDVEKLERISGVTELMNWYNYESMSSSEDFENGLIKVGDDVLISGFPGTSDSALDTSRPIMTSGVISSDPRYPYNLIAPDGPGESVLCHAFSWKGMSGGPVLGLIWSKSKVQLIGVNAGHISMQGEGAAGSLTHFVRVTAIREILKNDGVAFT